MDEYRRFRKSLERAAFYLLRLHYSMEYPKQYETISEYLDLSDLSETLDAVKRDATELQRLRGHLTDKQARQMDVSILE